MSASQRRAQFFVLEATEYLAELEQLVSRNDPPDLERLVRGARALRGAALMAGLGTFARAAAALEALARQLRDHALGWEPDARSGWREALQTLRGLVSRAAGWEAADDRHALLLTDRIERISRGETAPTPTAPTPGHAGLTPGVRAFIARESALIAGSLQQAARALAPLDPPAALGGVLERLRSLRGLGDATELSPLPELLDAMEVTTRCLLRAEPAPPDVAGVFADAADALAAMAQSVADHGQVVVPNGLDQVARRLLDGFATATDVVPIASLAPADEPSVISRGQWPPAMSPGDPVPVELVGVGDHLLLQGQALAAGRSPAARDLRLFVLHQTLTTMPRTSRTGHFLAPLSQALARTIENGTAHSDPDGFSGLLNDCGRFLVDHGGEASVAELTVRRDALAATLGVATPAADPPAITPSDTAAASPPPHDSEPVPIETLAPDPQIDEPEIVTIESLAPDPQVEEPEIVTIESLAPDPQVEEPAIVTIESLAPDGPAREESEGSAARLARAFRRLRELEKTADTATTESAEPEPEPTDIDALLYRGERALIRADEIRAELAEILSHTSVDLGRLRPLLDELLDLVPLARDAA